MKTSEAMATLEKNPELKCESINEYGKYELSVSPARFFHFKRWNNEGKYLEPEEGCGGQFNGNIGLDYDWHLVRTPVPWQEAIQAVLDGKEVTCECENCGETPDKCTYNLNDGICAYGIQNGTWHIEDDADA
jgi:hypothetical protein